MAPSAGRVAMQHLASKHATLYRVAMDVLRPWVPDADVLESYADAVVDDLVSGFRTVLTDPLAKAKVRGFGVRVEEQGSFDSPGHRGRTYHYWAKVEYPRSVTLVYGIVLDVVKRWNRAVDRHKPAAHIDARLDKLGVDLLDAIMDILGEVAEDSVPEHLSSAEQESVFDVLYSDPIRGIDTEAEGSEDTDEESESVSETYDVDARFALDVSRSQAKVDVVLDANRKVLVRFEVPIAVRFREIRSPWAHNYMAER